MVDGDSRRSRRIRRKLQIVPAFRQIDMMGVVHNAQYLLWFEEGRLQIMLEVMPLEEAIKRRILMPVIENRCFYHKPVRYDDPLVLYTTHQVQDSYDGRLVFEHSLVHDKTKVEMASGHTVATLVDLETGQLVRDWSADVWARYQALA